MEKAEFDLHASVEQRHWWFTARRQIMTRLVHELVPPGRATEVDKATDPNKTHTVLDIGCGTGANIAAMAQEYRAIGVDTSKYAIEHARQLAPRVEFHCTSDQARLAELVNQASVITIMDVLEHVPDDYAMLSQLLHAARPNTHFLLTVPANLSLWSKHDEVFGHYRRYDANRLESVWSGLDVECRLLSYFNARLYPIVRSIRQRKKKKEQGTNSHESDFKIPNAALNAVLQTIFAGESRKLVSALHSGKRLPYRQGVSIVAVLRRGEGDVAPRTRPADVTPDYYDPVGKRYLPQGENAAS